MANSEFDAIDVKILDAMAQEADEEAETAQMAEYPIPDNIY